MGDHSSDSTVGHLRELQRSLLGGGWYARFVTGLPFSLLLLLLLPFLNKPFHIDDRLYLEVARNIEANPLRPYAFPISFEGEEYPDAAGSSHLPLTAYYLAAVGTLSGCTSEWVYHLAFLIFPLIGAAAFTDLAGRFVSASRAATLILFVSPAVLVSSHSLMPDVPQLAFWILSISRFQALCEGSRKISDWLLAALGLVGAALLSVVTVGLIMLLAAYFWLARPESASRLAGLVGLASLPFLVWLVWYSYAFYLFGRLPLIDLVGYVVGRGSFDVPKLLEKVVALGLYIGGTVLVPVAVWFAGAAVGFRSTVTAALLSGVGVALLMPPSWGLFQRGLVFSFLSTAALLISVAAWALLKSFRPGSADRKFLFLSLWFWGALSLNLFVYYHGAVRYTLLALPPLVLMGIGMLEQARPRMVRLLLLILIGCTVPYSFLIARSDYLLAQMYRSAAETVVSEYSAPGRSIWFTAEWGLRHYLEQNGARLLQTTETTPLPGDLLVRPDQASPWTTLFDRQPYSTHFKTIVLGYWNPIHLMHPAQKAGFFSSYWGILPFGISLDRERDRLNILRISRGWSGPVADPPEKLIDASYAELRLRIVAAAERVIPKGAVTLVVCKGDDQLIQLLGENFRHFPQAPDGGYAGFYPADSAAATGELRALHRKGAKFIIFPNTAFWWLEHYAGLRQYLDSNALLILDDSETVLIYRLQESRLQTDETAGSAKEGLQ